MKNNFNLIFALLLLVSLYSCKEKEGEELQDTTEESVKEQIFAQTAFEDAENLAIELMLGVSPNFRTMKMSTANEICGSTKITHDEAKKTVLVDFGAGCKDAAGITRKGKLSIAYLGDFPNMGSQLTMTFDNYFMNGYKLEGTKITSTKALIPIPVSIEFNSQVKNGKLTWENGKITQLDATHVKKITLDQKTNEITMEVTGSSKGINRAGTNFLGAITNTLIFKDECLIQGITLASKGTYVFAFGDKSVEVDFGNGTCDKKMTLLYNGKTKEITVD